MRASVKLNIFGSLAAIFVITSIQCRVPSEICDFCQMENLPVCNASNLKHKRVNCESTKKSCVLRLANDDADNLIMMTISPDAVCLLNLDSASDQAFSSPLETVSVDGSKDTTLQTSDDSAELGNSFPSGATDKPEGSTSSEVNMFECLSCDSLSSDACLGGGDNLEAIKCDMPSECVTVFTDCHLTRNCSSAFSETILDLCRSSDATSCTLCQTPKCNNLPWNECYKCGAKEGRNCTLTSSIPTEICPNHNDECSVRITKTGDTVRGCSPAGSGCPPEEICSSCVEALCNSGVFPANRSRCIQCVGCEEGQDPSTALPCTRYVAEEKCFAYLTDKEKMIRGCASDITGMQQCNASAPKCVTCDDRDGCNDMPLMMEPSLSCHSCISKGDVGCAWAQHPSTLVRCRNKVPYYIRETCMAKFDPGRLYAVRGCSLDEEPCTPEDANCRTCSGDGCNGQDLKIQECIQCRSDAPGQKNCTELAKEVPPTQCPHQTSFHSRGCFTLLRGNATIRGCIVSLSPEDVNLCWQQAQFQCEICSADGCNDHTFKAQECIQCRSGMPGQESCSEQAQGMASIKCAQRTTFRASSCFIMIRENVTTRGCTQDLTPDDVQFCNVGGQSHCKFCTANGCNSHNLRVQKCIQCQSDAPGQASCSDHAQGLPPQKCVQQKMYGSGGCFTITRGNVTTRGCNDTLLAWTVRFCKGQGRFQCNICAGDGCNKLYARPQRCIQCNADAPGQASCTERPQELGSKLCPLYAKPFHREGCFTAKKGNSTLRGCLGELSKKDLDWCRGQGKIQCQLCLDDSCNNQPSQSGVQGVKVISLLIWILGVFAFVWN